jgi:hypothetical protein
VFDSDVRAVSGGFTLQEPPLIRSGESLGFVSSLSSMSTLMADGKVSGASRRAVDGTGIKSVNAWFADRETL